MNDRYIQDNYVVSGYFVGGKSSASTQNLEENSNNSFADLFGIQGVEINTLVFDSGVADDYTYTELNSSAFASRIYVFNLSVSEILQKMKDDGVYNYIAFSVPNSAFIIHSNGSFSVMYSGQNILSNINSALQKFSSQLKSIYESAINKMEEVNNKVEWIEKYIKQEIDNNIEKALNSITIKAYLDYDTPSEKAIMLKPVGNGVFKTEDDIEIGCEKYAMRVELKYKYERLMQEKIILSDDIPDYKKILGVAVGDVILLNKGIIGHFDRNKHIDEYLKCYEDGKCFVVSDIKNDDGAFDYNIFYNYNLTHQFLDFYPDNVKNQNTSIIALKALFEYMFQVDNKCYMSTDIETEKSFSIRKNVDFLDLLISYITKAKNELTLKVKTKIHGSYLLSDEFQVKYNNKDFSFIFSNRDYSIFDEKFPTPFEIIKQNFSPKRWYMADDYGVAVKTRNKNFFYIDLGKNGFIEIVVNDSNKFLETFDTFNYIIKELIKNDFDIKFVAIDLPKGKLSWKNISKRILSLFNNDKIPEIITSFDHTDFSKIIDNNKICCESLQKFDLYLKNGFIINNIEDIKTFLQQVSAFYVKYKPKKGCKNIEIVRNVSDFRFEHLYRYGIAINDNMYYIMETEDLYGHPTVYKAIMYALNGCNTNKIYFLNKSIKSVVFAKNLYVCPTSDVFTRIFIDGEINYNLVKTIMRKGAGFDIQIMNNKVNINTKIKRVYGEYKYVKKFFDFDDYNFTIVNSAYLEEYARIKREFKYNYYSSFTYFGYLNDYLISRLHDRTDREIIKVVGLNASYYFGLSVRFKDFMSRRKFLLSYDYQYLSKTKTDEDFIIDNIDLFEKYNVSKQFSIDFEEKEINIVTGLIGYKQTPPYNFVKMFFDLEFNIRMRNTVLSLKDTNVVTLLKDFYLGKKPKYEIVLEKLSDRLNEENEKIMLLVRCGRKDPYKYKIYIDVDDNKIITFDELCSLIDYDMVSLDVELTNHYIWQFKYEYDEENGKIKVFPKNTLASKIRDFVEEVMNKKLETFMKMLHTYPSTMNGYYEAFFKKINFVGDNVDIRHYIVSKIIHNNSNISIPYAYYGEQNRYIRETEYSNTNIKFTNNIDNISDVVDYTYLGGVYFCQRKINGKWFIPYSDEYADISSGLKTYIFAYGGYIPPYASHPCITIELPSGRILPPNWLNHKDTKQIYDALNSGTVIGSYSTEYDILTKKPYMTDVNGTVWDMWKKIKFVVEYKELQLQWSLKIEEYLLSDKGRQDRNKYSSGGSGGVVSSFKLEPFNLGCGAKGYAIHIKQSANNVSDSFIEHSLTFKVVKIENKQEIDITNTELGRKILSDMRVDGLNLLLEDKNGRDN